MSSTYVRQTITAYVEAEAPTENFIPLFATFQTVPELLEHYGLDHDSPWIGMEFQSDDEIPVTIGSTNTEGTYRENGVIYFHIVDVAILGAGDSILQRGETLRDLLRGLRINGDIIIESVSPMNFNNGATLQFEGGYVSGSFIVAYEYEKIL